VDARKSSRAILGDRVYKSDMKQMPITCVETLELQPRPPCLLIDGKIVELPPDSAGFLIRALEQALSDLLDNEAEPLLLQFEE